MCHTTINTKPTQILIIIIFIENNASSGGKKSGFSAMKGSRSSEYNTSLPEEEYMTISPSQLPIGSPGMYSSGNEVEEKYHSKLYWSTMLLIFWRKKMSENIFVLFNHVHATRTNLNIKLNESIKLIIKLFNGNHIIIKQLYCKTILYFVFLRRQATRAPCRPRPSHYLLYHR